MNGNLIAGFVLLVVMVFLILRPFVAPAIVGVPNAEGPDADLTDAAARARAAARVESVAVVDAAPATTAVPTAPPTAAAVAPVVASGGDVRASVEAAIAARKAALSGAAPADTAGHCPSCQSSVEPDDAFCRACGAKQTA